MTTHTFSYKNQDYTIRIMRENVRSATAMAAPDWLVTAVDRSNAQYANVRFKDSVLTYILQSNGKTAEDFLSGLAQYEVELNVE